MIIFLPACFLLLLLLLILLLIPLIHLLLLLPPPHPPLLPLLLLPFLLPLLLGAHQCLRSLARARYTHPRRCYNADALVLTFSTAAGVDLPRYARRPGALALSGQGTQLYHCMHSTGREDPATALQPRETFPVNASTPPQPR